MSGLYNLSIYMSQETEDMIITICGWLCIFICACIDMSCGIALCRYYFGKLRLSNDNCLDRWKCVVGSTMLAGITYCILCKLNRP